MDTLDPTAAPDSSQFQPVSDADFAPSSLANVQGSSSSTAPAPVDNPDPTTNGEIPAPEPAPSASQLQPVTDADFATPSITDKIKSGFSAVNQAAGSAADQLVRPFVGQQGIDEAPGATQAAGQWLKTKDQQIATSKADPNVAALDLALGGDPDKGGSWDVSKDVASRGFNATGAFAGKVDQTAVDLANTAMKVAGVAPYIYDKASSLITDTPQSSAYDWWNKNVTVPGQQASNTLGSQSEAEANASGVVGQTASVGGAVVGQLGEMALAGPENAAAKISAALPSEGFAGAYNVIKDGLSTSLHYSKLPAAVTASKTYDAVYQQTGDPEAALKASVVAGATVPLINTLPLSSSGPILYKMFTGGLTGAAGSEASRVLNNEAMPDNMQEPFSWKGLFQNAASGAAIATAFATKEQEDYQAAYIRYNGIQKAAADGNLGAKRTADVIDTLSQVNNNIDNNMVDSAVHGVVVSNAKMSKTHEQLQTEDPRYAAIFKATQNGPAAVDPQTGEQIARDAYANEVSINAAFDKYTELTGAEGQSVKLAKNAANLMDMAHKVVPAPELNMVARWAAYDQPSQLQFNNVLDQTIQEKQAPDYIHSKYDTYYDKDGIPNEQAYLTDHAARPDSFDAFYAPDTKVEQALKSGGIHYYRMADGRLAIRGHTTQYTTNVFSHIYDQTGITPLKPGESYGKQSQSATDTQQENGPENTGTGNAQGSEAGEGSQAETRKPEQPNGQQNGDEGHGAGVGTGSVLGDEGTGDVHEGSENLTPRAVPVAEALAKAGVSAPISPTGRVDIDGTSPDAAKIIDATATDAAEHPESERKPVTDNQKSSGNYAVGKINLTSAQGDVPVDIENPSGSIRKSMAGAPDKWSRKMIDAHYGRIPGTISADGEPLDVFLTKDAPDPNRPVALLSQHDPKTGAFDEMKVVMGAKSKGEAMSVYAKQYPLGLASKLLPEGKGNIVMMSRPKFIEYIKSGAVDVPPHPVSGAPMLSLRDNVPFEGDTGTANMDDMADKVQAVNAKHGTDLAYDRTNDTVSGTIPSAKALSIHKSFSRIDGYAGSKVNDQPIGQHVEAAGSREASPASGRTASGHGDIVDDVQRGVRQAGGEIQESPRASGAEKAVSDAPIFHEGHSAHPVSVVGVHYSNTPDLKELDPTMAGTGSAGGERRSRGMGRFGNSGDPMDAMTSFYVRNGKGLPAKESAVAGSHPYEARLNNLYDMNHDPDGIYEDAVRHGTQMNRDAVLESIHDAGYDGYVYDAGAGQKGKIATVFGVHGKIPVKDVGKDYLAKNQNVDRHIGPTEKDERQEKINKLKDNLADKTSDAIKDKLKESESEPEDSAQASHLMFAGERAATGDKAALEKAKTLESTAKSEGKSVSDIEALTHGTTGWSRGTDGKWRFEINDKNSALKPGVLDKSSDLTKLMRSEKGAPLDKVLDHPSLFEAYPQIGNDIHVKIEDDMPAEMGAAFDPDTKTIMFHSMDQYKKTGDQSVLSIIHHETQHVIQSVEGHAQGGNPFQFLEPLKEQRTALRQQFDDATEELDQLHDAYLAKGGDIDKLDDFDKTDPRAKELSDTIDRISDMADKQGLTNYNSMMQIAHKQYMRVAGENEAYNTQERLGMTDVERRALPPSMTEKYPRLEQIVQYDHAPSAHMESDEETAQRKQAHHDAVQSRVDTITKTWRQAPPLHVVQTREELPENVQHYLDQFLEPGELPKGLYDNQSGHVYVFSHALDHPDDAGRVILHEAIGHYGLHSNKTLGKDLPKLLDEIHASVKDTPEFKRIAKLYQRVYGHTPDAKGRRDLAEEYLAKVAENGKNPTIMQRVVAFVHDAMRRMGMSPRWSEGDIATMMAKVHRDVVEGRVNDRGLESPQSVFNRDGSVTSSYRGAAGEGTLTVHPDGRRELDIGTLHAELTATTLNGHTVNSIGDLKAPSPGDLAALARFTQEEGRAGVAIGKGNATKAQIEASGVPFKERPGFYELASTEKLPADNMFSLRNRAKGDPEEERILDKVIDHSDSNMTPWDRLQKTARDMRDDVQSGELSLETKQSFIDAGASIENYERKANGGLLLDAAESAYKSYWMSRNNEQITAGVLKNGVPEYKAGSFVSVPGHKGFIDMLAPLYRNTPDGKPLDSLFEGYAVAHRANELIKQTNPDGTPKEKLMTQPEIDKMMALDQKYPQFKKVLSDIQDFNKQLLDLAVDRGAMSKDVAAMWKQNMYVPFYRSMESDVGHGIGNDGHSVSGKKVTSKKLFGSTKQIEPVIESIVKNTGSILDKIYSNEAMRRIVGLTDGIGMERVKMPMQAIRMTADDAIHQLAKAGIDVDKSNLTPDDLNTLTTMFRPQRPVGKDIVSVVENGKNIYYRVTDPLLLRSVTNMNSIGDIGKVMDTLLGGIKRVYTAATTLDPRFMMRIMFKDAMQSWIQTGTNPNMFKHLMGNAKDVLTDSKFLNDLRVAGYNGNEYYRIDELRDLMKHLGGDKWTVLNTPAKLWDAYKHVGWMSEQASRLSVAKHTLDNGGTMAEAAWQGQNTLNWQKRGDGKLAQYIMRGAPFMNAHIQGATRLYDGMLGRDVTMNRSKAVTSFFLKAISLTLPTLALNLYNQQNKAYERLPDEAKDLYWHFFVGDKHFTLAKPFEAGAITATIPERVMRVLQGKDTKHTFVESMSDVVNQMFGMNPIPQAVLPLAEELANRQQLGSSIPIVSSRLQDLQPGAQVADTTSPTVTAIARHMPQGAPDILRSPVRLQHLIRGYTSSIGMYALQLADAGARAAGYAPPAPASRFGGALATGLAHVANVEKTDSDTRNRYVDEVYSAQHDADAAAKTIRTYVKQGHLDDAREVMQNNRTALQYRNELHAVSSKMGELRTIEQNVTLSRTLTPEQKREKLDDINKLRARMLDRVAPMLDMVNDYH